MPPNDSSTGGFLLPYASPLVVEDDALDAVLQALVVGVTGLPATSVRPRWQPESSVQPEPLTNWCAIGVIDETSEENTANVHIGAPAGPTGFGYTKSYQNDVITVLASFYGSNARGNAALMRSGLMVPQNREALTFNQTTQKGTNIQLMESPGPTQFVPAVVSQQTLRRADISMRFRRKIIRLWPIDDLAGATITVQTDSKDDDSETINVTPSP